MTDIGKIIEEAKAAILPFESWERLTGETGLAYAAFCAYRDYGPDRNIRRAVETALAEKDGEAGADKVEKRYRMWRVWAMQFRWRERAADYDQYLDRLKQTEVRKTIEEQGKVHRTVTKKMLQVVEKKLDLMNPADLTQGTVKEWVETAIRTDREAYNPPAADCLGVCVANSRHGSKGNIEPKQGEINFTPEFKGL